jgi:NAD(P)H-hydrate epimerase
LQFAFFNLLPLMSNLPCLPPRRPDSHKGDYGRALLIGGSWGMAGAISLAGMACLRSGAGLVRLAVPAGILETVAGFEPSYMTVPLFGDKGRRIGLTAGDLQNITALAAQATCVAIGPGLGQSAELTALVCAAYQTLKQPLVVDADALNALAAASSDLAQHSGPRILTPHPGEFCRLAKLTPDTPRGDQITRAKLLAEEMGTVILLKGNQTLITDGTRQVVNETGNPGMATGGTGDVLTGVITALVCQGLTPFDAAVLGAHVHGLAGDLAAAELGQVSLIASDLLRYLPKAFQAVA